MFTWCGVTAVLKSHPQSYCVKVLLHCNCRDLSFPEKSHSFLETEVWELSCEGILQGSERDVQTDLIEIISCHPVSKVITSLLLMSGWLEFIRFRWLLLNQQEVILIWVQDNLRNTVKFSLLFMIRLSKKISSLPQDMYLLSLTSLIDIYSEVVLNFSFYYFIWKCIFFQTYP